jgi:hypothetical protein
MQRANFLQGDQAAGDHAVEDGEEALDLFFAVERASEGQS